MLEQEYIGTGVIRMIECYSYAASVGHDGLTLYTIILILNGEP